MKRTSTKIVVLLGLLAAALFLTGCPKDAEMPDSTPAGKGEWVEAPVFPLTRSPANYQFWAGNEEQKEYTFCFDKSEITLSDTLNNVATGVTSSHGYGIQVHYDNYTYIGCEMDIIVTSGNPGTTVIDFNKSLGGNWYELSLEPGYFTLYEYESFHGSPLQYHKSNSAIKGTGQTNKVKIVTLENGNIAIYVNNTLLYTIENPKFHEGSYSIYARIMAEDLADDANPINITWKNIKLQKASE